MDLIRTVVVVGGGSAGWIAASYLAKRFQETVRVVVIESPDVPTLGVGEATVPNLQKVLFDHLGIPEFEWMRECNASFKTAVRFINWSTAGEGSLGPRLLDGRADHYYHPFGLLPDCDGVPLSHYWFYKALRGGRRHGYHYDCQKEPPLLDANLGPRHIGGPPATRYAWHFDAALVAKYLCRLSVDKLGVSHIRANVASATFDDRGFIESLILADGRRVEGDLFVDCSGFRGLLINQFMKEPFVDMHGLLLCDSAIACSVDYQDRASGMEPYTSAIAMRSGWTWKIPLSSRIGTGYVYSSDFLDADGAVEEFCGLWGLNPDRAPLKRIRFRVGRNRRSWVKNCVSIGTSSCFLEPLESTGIYFTYAGAYQLAKHFPDRNCDPVLADRFNQAIATMFDDSRDFIQAHFYLSPRTDTEFWRANKDLKLSEGLAEKMERYEAGLPINAPVTDEASYYGNFDAEFNNFWTNGSYCSIFTGLGYLPKKALPSLHYRPSSVARAEACFAGIKQWQQSMAASLPSNCELVDWIHGNSAGAAQAERQKPARNGSPPSAKLSKEPNSCTEAVDPKQNAMIAGNPQLT